MYIYIYKSHIRIAGVYIGGSGITGIFFLCFRCNVGSVKKKNFMKDLDTSLGKAFCLSWGECPRLLHGMGPLDRPREHWDKLKAGPKAGPKHFPAKTRPPASLHPDGNTPR